MTGALAVVVLPLSQPAWAKEVLVWRFAVLR
jgi:hypothetical protein